MPDFAVATVTRTEYNLPALELSSSTGYFIARNGIGPGGLQHRKVSASSPFVDGSFLVHKSKEMAMTTLAVNVRGDSAAQLHTRMSILTECFEQFNYIIDITIDGVDYSWVCETADYDIGDDGGWDDLKLRSYHQGVTFSIPRMPDFRQ